MPNPTVYTRSVSTTYAIFGFSIPVKNGIKKAPKTSTIQPGWKPLRSAGFSYDTTNFRQSVPNWTEPPTLQIVQSGIRPDNTTLLDLAFMAWGLLQLKSSQSCCEPIQAPDHINHDLYATH